jgi:hypothetical protein
MMENSEQKQVPISAELQQNIQMLNLRINDMMQAMNTVFKMLMDENQAMRAEVATLKASDSTVKPKA